MMKKLLATAALTASAAALAAPAAQADDHWTATGTALCAGDLVVAPAAKAVSPLPLTDAAPACGKGSLIHNGG
ncbi:hypothetical protein [Streptomyces diastatochromogenes]|uniref:hypothetical protein n=1 Tax=Streptomyces diastatochromogenes TaxID=42236 RepID=UPI00365F5DCB